MFKYSYKKVGGLHFLKLGKLCFMFCTTIKYKSLTWKEI